MTDSLWKHFLEQLFCSTSLFNYFWHVDGCLFWVVLSLCFSFHFCFYLSLFFSFSLRFLFSMYFSISLCFSFFVLVTWNQNIKIGITEVTFGDSKLDTLTIIWSLTFNNWFVYQHTFKETCFSVLVWYLLDQPNLEMGLRVHSFLHSNCHH